MEMHNKGEADKPPQTPGDQLIWYFRRAVEVLSAVVLAADLVVAFCSVIWRYFLHSPLQWSDDVGQLLLIALTFFGGAAALARGEHLGVVALRSRLSKGGQHVLQALSGWVVGIVAGMLCWSAISYIPINSATHTTASGIPQSFYFYPMIGCGAAMVVFAIAALLKTSWRAILVSALVLGFFALVWVLWGQISPDTLPAPLILLLVSFVFCLLSGIPIGFSLGFAALVFMWTDGTLPSEIFSQEMQTGLSNLVLTAIPFFVLVGLIMDVNGMSTRLIGLLQLLIGRVRGGLHVVMIASMALFSGLSGSKNADVAAVGSMLIPAMREDGQDVGDAVALLASTAVMGETIPPSINIIILGSVANLSIGGLFAAGILPAATMAAALIITAVIRGERHKRPSTGATRSREIGSSEVPPGQIEFENPPVPQYKRMSLVSLIAGGLLALLMLVIIFGGILGGIATPTEVSAFAAVFALVAGWAAFRQMTPRSALKAFVDSASLSGMILFIVAAAQIVAFILTIAQVPQTMVIFMTNIAATYGNWAFLLVSIVLLICMGSVLEGAPALIIFGPLLVPIAVQLGIQPLHFGVVMVIAMGFGLFAPPLGVGFYTSCAVGGVKVEDVVRPSLKYLAIVFVTLLIITFIPWITLAIPQALGLH